MAPSIVLAQEVRGEDHRVQGGCRGGGGGREGGKRGRRGLTYVTGVVCSSKDELWGTIVARADVGHIGLSSHQYLSTVWCVCAHVCVVCTCITYCTHV